MSIVRHLTTRLRQPEFENEPAPPLGRAASQRGGRPIHRSQISSPVALVSTTNMLSYNAPNIAGTAPVEYRDLNSGSSGASAMSSEDSDGSGGSLHSRETVTEPSSVETSPTSPDPEPNHLSCYFRAPGVTDSPSLKRSLSNAARPSLDAPNLPRRSPSHSKTAHEAVNRQRSVRRANSPPRQLGRPSMESAGSGSTAFVEAPRDNPFGKELAKLDEIAEEYGGTARQAEATTDAAYMKRRGLAQHGASDYLNEIHSLINVLLTDDRSPHVPDFCGWF